MVGAITERDILAHPLVTISCFGWGVFWRAFVCRSPEDVSFGLGRGGTPEACCGKRGRNWSPAAWNSS